MDNLKPKKQRTILEWFLNAVKSKRNQMTVPLHIVELSCGCKRKEDDKPFTIRQSNSGYWKHGDCDRILEELPRTDLYYKSWSGEMLKIH